MTVKEFKAWLEGFNEGRNNGWSAGLSEENWKLVQDKIASLEDAGKINYDKIYQVPSILGGPTVTS